MEENFKKHRVFLVDRIDPNFGLLDKLLASGTLTREAVHEIKLNDNTTERKNRILLDFILKNRKFDELISALKDSGQTHLINYLNADGGHRLVFGDDWPLRESEIRQLEINWESLVDVLDTSDLCSRLYSEKVINDRQRQFILSKPINAEKNEALLDILTKCSIRQYNKTIDCLKVSNQGHIGKLLSEGGVAVRVHANLEGAVGNTDELEDDIVAQLKNFLENHPIDKVTRWLDLTKLELIAANKGQSIVMYIHCQTHDDLLQLIDQLKTERLTGIIQRLFTEMLSIGDVLRVTLSWSLEEFNRAAKFFDIRLPSSGQMDGSDLTRVYDNRSRYHGQKSVQRITALSSPGSIRPISTRRSSHSGHKSTGLSSLEMYHAEAIERNNDVLLRCTHINLFVIDFLKAEDVLDEAQESDLKAEKSHLKQRLLLFQWLKEVSSDRYEAFLQVMKDAEQEHVANLLTGSNEVDHMPLSDARYTRLKNIRHRLAYVAQVDNEVIAELRSLRAISMTDVEEIRAETVDYAKVSKLISAIMRRSNYSYRSFQEVLRKTLQTAAAEYLEEGEMPAVHIKSNQPDLDRPLSLAFNGLIRNMKQDDAEIKELLADLNDLSLYPIRVIPGQSIVVFIYCKTVDSAVKFTQLYNSGRLQNILESILKRLLLTIEPQNAMILDSLINMEEEEILTLEEFTGIEGWIVESCKRQEQSIEIYRPRCDASTQTGRPKKRRKPRKRNKKKPNKNDSGSPSLAVEVTGGESQGTLEKLASGSESATSQLEKSTSGSIVQSSAEAFSGRKSWFLDPSSATSPRVAVLGGSPDYLKPCMPKDSFSDFEDVHGYFRKPIERSVSALQKRKSFIQKPYISKDSYSDFEARNDDIFQLKRKLEETQKENDKLTKQLKLQGERVSIAWKQEDFYLKLKLEETQKDNARLLKLLEYHAQRGEYPERYKSDPILVQTIRIGASEKKNKSIKGLTILDKELFVVIEDSSEVEVYDSTKFSFSRRWNLSELNCPMDIGSCNTNKWLYILNSNGADQSKEILRVDATGKMLKSWSAGEDGLNFLSVTKESNVIVAVYDRNKINEYSPDGLLIRDINLSSIAGIHNPLHAIQMTNGHFLISHMDDDHHFTVSAVDSDGKLQKSLSGESKLIIGEMCGPFYLFVDGNGFVLVADPFNSRVLLFNSDLEFHREILSTRNSGLSHPSRIHLDEINGRLYVVDSERMGQRISIFLFK